MPFSPGVQDISGQIRAQGRVALAQGIGQGVSDFARNYAQSQEENAKFNAKSKAMENLVKTHAELFGLSDPEKLKQALDTNPRETPIAKYERLSSMVEGSVMASKMKQAEDARKSAEQQRQMQAMQMQAMQAEIAQRNTDQKAISEALRMLPQPMYQQSAAGEAVAQGGFGADIQGMPTAATMRKAPPPDVAQIVQRMAAGGASPEAMARLQKTIEMFRPKTGGGLTMTTEELLKFGNQANVKATPNPDMPGTWNVTGMDTLTPKSEERPTVIPAGSTLERRDPKTGQVTRETIPSLPPGYRMSADGKTMEPIPGSPASADVENVQTKAKNAAKMHASKLEVMNNAISNILPKIGYGTAGLGALTSQIPGTPAYDLSSQIDTLKAQIGFKELQDMRAASPTGGALGQVAVQELEMLQAALGNLSKYQSPDQLRENVHAISRHLKRWNSTVDGVDPDAKETGDKLNSGVSSSEVSTLVPQPLSAAEQKRLAELRKKLGK